MALCEKRASASHESAVFGKIPACAHKPSNSRVCPSKLRDSKSRENWDRSQTLLRDPTVTRMSTVPSLLQSHDRLERCSGLPSAARRGPSRRKSGDLTAHWMAQLLAGKGLPFSKAFPTNHLHRRCRFWPSLSSCAAKSQSKAPKSPNAHAVMLKYPRLIESSPDTDESLWKASTTLPKPAAMRSKFKQCLATRAAAVARVSLLCCKALYHKLMVIDLQNSNTSVSFDQPLFQLRWLVWVALKTS